MKRKPPGRAPVKSKATRKGGADDLLPTREAILAFVANAEGKVGKREIARAFGIGRGARIALKRRLGEMAADGTLAGNKRELRQRGKIAPVSVIEVTGRDGDGDLIGRPVVWDAGDGERPNVLIVPARNRERDDLAKVTVGDRVLARITQLDGADVDGLRYQAEPIRVLPRDKRRMLGIFRESARGGGTIEPIDRRELKTWSVDRGDEGGAASGDLVRFDLSGRTRQVASRARVLETLGNPDDQRKISLIAVHAHGIPDEFPDAVLAETEMLTPPVLAGRTDLRAIPLITIDPADARDHDDAVFAEADTDARNKGGHVVIVAIADVAHYVRPGSKLDREAELRGNSVYFPDRVVPMLPERISNDLCSLREAEDRPCLAVRMIFDRDGNKKTHTFLRAMMRSAAKLSYQEAQAAIDGSASDKAGPLVEPVLKPLWAAYASLKRARDVRGPLDLDLPERKILLDAEGRVARVVTPERLDAHRLIEEFMIQANVAAAEALEARKAAVVYRIHEPPSKEKLKNLRDFLESLEMHLPQAAQLRPSAFNGILAKAKSLPVPELVNEVILRSQAQAEYNPENAGHFGLNLQRYAHFTSPIRRYADLLVHRALIGAFQLGEGGVTEVDRGRLADTARAISEAERRAMAAERETADRLIAAHLADRVGATFTGRIAGVTRAGLFVKLSDTGADGFVPMSTLGRDYFHLVEETHTIVGTRTGASYRLGDTVEVRLVEAIPTAGALRFEMLSEGTREAPRGPVRGVPRGMRRPKGRGRPR